MKLSRKKILPEFIKRIPGFRRLNTYLYRRYNDHINNPFIQFSPPGHFYSPLPDIEFIKGHQEALFARDLREVPGLDVNERGQLELFDDLSSYYPEIPWKAEKSNGLRYYFDNEYFTYADAIVLYAMIRHFKPRRIIEIGSGFSSASMLDISELFFNNSIDFTFIEPYPEILYSLLKKMTGILWK
jgi:hypothetical protein